MYINKDTHKIETMQREQENLSQLRQDIIDNNLHVKAIIQVSKKQNGNKFTGNLIQLPLFLCVRISLVFVAQLTS